jgi:uncharacterized surface protein with fasciclin (FAS1) repeats
MTHPTAEKVTPSGVLMISLFMGAVFLALLSTKAAAEVPVPDEQRAPLPTIYEAALQNAASPEFSELVGLLQVAFGETLDDIFDGETKYTIFGPTNEALDDFLASLTSLEATALMEDEDGILTQLLLYHVTEGDYYQTDFPFGAIQMLSADIASIYRDGESFAIQGSPILGETILRNGTFHGIDSVLLPPGFLEGLESAATTPYQSPVRSSGDTLDMPSRRP